LKAAILYDVNQSLSIEDIQYDEPQGQEILVKFVGSGVCHSDLHAITGDIPQVLPIVLGHEGAGIVEKVGPGVTMFQPGDHVIVMVSYSCGKCRYCVEGKPTMCVGNMDTIVMASLPGGVKRLRKGDQELGQFMGVGSFAEYAVVHERQAVKVRNDAPLDIVCLLGCGVSTGIGAAVCACGVRPGESIAIFGCGGVGLSAVMGAKLAGAGKIIAIDTLDEKLAMAKELGADFVINAKQEDPVFKVTEFIGGGADYAIECIGNVEVMAAAVSAIHNGGKLVILGSAPVGTTLNVFPFEYLNGKTITGSVQGSIRPFIDIPRYVDLFMAGKLPIDKLITKTYSLNKVNEAMDALKNGKVMRSVIKF
jgi:S-(hydroxymethyl)glutathione dehydrogenase / alcohol dehydrogenase